jgi:hypothetical protein
VSRRDADERGGEVVDDVQRDRDLRGVIGAVTGREQVGRAQNQQRRGDVAELEHRHTDHQAAQPAPQHRTNPQP